MKIRFIKSATVNYIDPTTAIRYAEELGSILTRVIAYTMQIRQAHWCTKGMSFSGVHPLYDEVYEHLADAQDLIAERIVQLGFPTRASYDHLAKILGQTYCADTLNVGFGEKEYLDITVRMGQELSGAFHTFIESFAKEENISADILIEVGRQLDKDLWKLQAHLEGPKLN